MLNWLDKLTKSTELIIEKISVTHFLTLFNCFILINIKGFSIIDAHFINQKI